MAKKKLNNTSFKNSSAPLVAPLAPLAPEVTKTPKMRVSGHLIDQKLKPFEPRPYQPNLFDSILGAEIEGEIQEQGITMIGVTLSPSEDKLIYGLVALLKDKSENKDESSISFYKGNYDIGYHDWGGENTKGTAIEITPADLYKAYMGSSSYSGKDTAEINKTLTSLANKKFLVKYERKRKVKVGKKEETRTDIIEKYCPLISILSVAKDLTDEEVAKYNEGDNKIRQAKGKLVIAISPLFTDQIEKKYVSLPHNVTQITEKAAGSSRRVTTAINMLRDYLFRELSNRRYKPEINKENLIYQLHLTKLKQEGRKAYVEKSLSDAIATCINMELIISYKLTTGAEGQEKYIFTLNKDFL